MAIVQPSAKAERYIIDLCSKLCPMFFKSIDRSTIKLMYYMDIRQQTMEIDMYAERKMDSKQISASVFIVINPSNPLLKYRFRPIECPEWL